MWKLIRSRGTLYCFSPFVMAMTFAIEMLLAIYVWLRYRATSFGRTVAFSLVLLGIFQGMEYLICATDHSEVLWARIGMASVTLLPVLGLRLVSLTTRKNHFLKFGYLIAVLFCAYYIFWPGAIQSATCGGNYVIFSSDQVALYWTYGIYYFTFLLLGIWECLEKIFEIRRRDLKKTVLIWLIVGYLSFMLPMAVAYMIYPEVRQAVASVMCGFALFLALILAFKTTPAYQKSQNQAG